MARGVRYASRALLIATALCLAAVVLGHFALLPDWLPLEALLPGLLVAGLVVGVCAAYARPISPMDAARLAEARLGLKERLSSALEFERLGAPPDDPEAALLRRLQSEDAAAHARAVRAADAVPLRLPWEAKALIPALILLLLALVLPALPIFTPPAVRTEHAVVAKEGEKLTRAARTLEKQADGQKLGETKRAAQNIRKLGQRMAQGRMDKKQAMREMHALSKQMADAQRRQAQANSQPGQGNDKSLAQAGSQLGQSLQNGTSAGKSAKTNPDAAKPGQSGAKTGAPGQKGQSSGAHAATPEVKNAADAMRHVDAHALAEQLRRLAQRAEAGHMSPSEQQQAGQDVQKLAQSLQNTPYTQTQQHTQAAGDAMKRGDMQTAARELRQAADAAEREAQQQADARGLQNAQQSVQNGQQEMAQANKPGDIPQNGQPEQGNPSGQSGPQSKSGQSGQSAGKPGQGNSQGQGKGQPSGQASGQSGGAPGNEGSGDGPSTASAPGKGQYTPASGRGQTTPGHKTGVVRGAPHPLNPKFDPAKNPKYGKIFLGKPNGNGGGGKSLPSGKPTPPPPGTHQASAVPYENYAAPAKKSAESAMDKEDIPPSYKSGVRRYFDSLQPTSPAGGAHK